MKKAPSKKYKIKEETPPMVSEPMAMYMPIKRIAQVQDFPYKKFQKIAANVPFTQKEWANILHLSERTLQRYASNNNSFEGIYTDRILQIQQLIELGLQTFISAEAFYRWLKTEKTVFNHTLTFESLYSAQGIQDVTNQIGRILHNVYT
jgi:uncharacterized protein (DUF2384 family)